MAFRCHTLLPLDNCLYALQGTLPHLTQSALHRCLQRHAISYFPDMADEKSGEKKFKAYPIGSFHIDIAEVRTEAGKLSLFVAMDRTGKTAYAELHADANTLVAAQCLWNLRAAIPYKIHTVLTDHGIQFTNRTRDRDALHHFFDRVCQEYGIDQWLTTTKPSLDPWSRGTDEPHAQRGHREKV